MHMACAVGGSRPEDKDVGVGVRLGADPQKNVGGSEVHEVTFLYKLAQGESPSMISAFLSTSLATRTSIHRLGACPRSYGTNVARLAGLPERVVKRAAHMSRAKEQGEQEAAGASVALDKPSLPRAPSSWSRQARARMIRWFPSVVVW